MKNLCLALGLLYSLSLSSQTYPTIYFVGHSLVNLDMPYQFRGNRFAAGAACDFMHHVNIGASLKANWFDPDFNGNIAMNPNYNNDWVEHGSNHLVELQAGHYDHLVMTEALPLVEQNADTTIKYARNFYNLANQHNPGIQSYLYQTWEFVPAGNYAAWRATIDDLLPYWENLAAQIPPSSSAPDLKIIPGGLALAALYDTLQLHPVGWLNSMADVFSDDVHLKNVGNYLISLVHYAVIFQQSPVGLPVVMAGPYQTGTVEDDPVVRLKLQQIAWAVASSYAPAGVLPVEYMAPFSARRIQPSTVLTQWETAVEKNVDRYEVEQSADGVDFETVGAIVVKNHNTQTLQSYALRITAAKSAYYRLRAIDLDGSDTYSNMVFVGGREKEFAVFPTVASSEMRISPAPAQGTAFQIANAMGQLVAHGELQSETISVADLPVGRYFLQIKEGAALYTLGFYKMP